jgi:hypothetical protein
MLNRSNVCLLLGSLLICGSSARAHAQADPRNILAGVISQVQTGTPNPAWYGPQLWHTIAMQTGNTGIYPQLLVLGPVTNISLLQQQELPQGWLFAMTATHLLGESNWILGIDRFSNRIEYVSFYVGPGPNTLPHPGPTPPVVTGPTPPPTPRPAPNPDPPNPGPAVQDSEACRKFPLLC